MGDTQTEPLIVLGIEIELATGPEVIVYEDIRFARLTKVVSWMKAISATVGRMKSGLALQDFNSDGKTPVPIEKKEEQQPEQQNWGIHFDRRWNSAASYPARWQ